MSELPNVVYGAGVPSDGRWHHWSATFDGADVSFYVDGVRIYPLTGGDTFGEGDE